MLDHESYKPSNNRVSNTGQNYTVSETSVSLIPSKIHFGSTGTMIVKASKIYFSIVVPQVDGRVFSTFVGKHQRI